MAKKVSKKIDVTEIKDACDRAKARLAAAAKVQAKWAAAGSPSALSSADYLAKREIDRLEDRIEFLEAQHAVRLAEHELRCALDAEDSQLPSYRQIAADARAKLDLAEELTRQAREARREAAAVVGAARQRRDQVALLRSSQGLPHPLAFPAQPSTPLAKQIAELDAFDAAPPTCQAAGELARLREELVDAKAAAERLAREARDAEIERSIQRERMARTAKRKPGPSAASIAAKEREGIRELADAWDARGKVA